MQVAKETTLNTFYDVVRTVPSKEAGLHSGPYYHCYCDSAPTATPPVSVGGTLGHKAELPQQNQQCPRPRIALPRPSSDSFCGRRRQEPLERVPSPPITISW